VYLAFVPVTVFGPPLVVLIDGDRIRPSLGGLAIVALLLLALPRGSLIAWLLLLLWNLFIALSVAVASGGEWLLPGAALSLLVAAVSSALLLTPSMLEHVGLRDERR
jgi:hypothetical protein